VPESIGRFKIVEKLGEGGMGIVYAAEDESLGRRVALKKLRESRDAVARQRLLREARVAASVNHPNVCQVYEIGEDADELYIVMELIDGEPLEVRMGRGPLALGEVLQATLEGAAEQHAHGPGHEEEEVAHRHQQTEKRHSETHHRGQAQRHLAVIGNAEHGDIVKDVEIILREAPLAGWLHEWHAHGRKPDL